MSVWVEIILLFKRIYVNIVTLHVSVWVEIKYYSCSCTRCIGHAPRERVSWNIQCKVEIFPCSGHAPRERVSWNSVFADFSSVSNVTLHVSVWVEIPLTNLTFTSSPGHAPRERVSWNAIFQCTGYCYQSRSTWACELKWFNFMCSISHSPVTLHVSVWVEILCRFFLCRGFLRSRSTWACELKFEMKDTEEEEAESRSTWACELKSESDMKMVLLSRVTLHVSVWVEISNFA